MVTKILIVYVIVSGSRDLSIFNACLKSCLTNKPKKSFSKESFNIVWSVCIKKVI
jgi:hypothetical protein